MRVRVELQRLATKGLKRPRCGEAVSGLGGCMEYVPKSEEERQALEAGALSWPDRKQQRWGEFFWRPAGPFDWTGCDDVEVMVGRLSGVPTVGHSRFSADSLLALHEDGMSAEEIVNEFELDLGRVQRILLFAAERKQHSVSAAA